MLKEAEGGPYIGRRRVEEFKINYEIFEDRRTLVVPSRAFESSRMAVCGEKIGKEGSLVGSTN